MARLPVSRRNISMKLTLLPFAFLGKEPGTSFSVMAMQAMISIFCPSVTAVPRWRQAVSYTHLDVYKRQPCGPRCGRMEICSERHETGSASKNKNQKFQRKNGNGFVLIRSTHFGVGICFVTVIQVCVMKKMSIDFVAWNQGKTGFLGIIPKSPFSVDVQTYFLFFAANSL